MTLPELARPILLFATGLRRKIERRLPLDYSNVKREAGTLLARADADAARAGLSDRWNRAKTSLAYLLDEIAIMHTWSGAAEWNDHSLEVEHLGHAEKMRGVWFYEREYAHAIESGDAELIEILYCCLCLGFEGKYRGQTAQLKNQIDNLFVRLGAAHRDPNEKLCPAAYTVDLTTNDPRAPMRLLMAAVIFVGIVATYYVVNEIIYGNFVGELGRIVASMMQHSQSG